MRANPTTAFLGLGSGIGLVVANMVGAGVFLSAGFMAQDLGPGWILCIWLGGAVLAIAGARTYAEAAILIPRSGGEYRYLSELIHPAVGYMAGWASLLVGFSAPMAISAYGAAAFLLAVASLGGERAVASLLIASLTLFHSLNLRASKWTQNGLVVAKGLLLAAFVGVGLALGRGGWPTWTPVAESPNDAASVASGLFFVAYAFSGWNAATYVADEFHDPRRNVPRAMLLGCAIVGVTYLLVNWVFVANLTPERAQAVFHYEEARVTLAHLVAQDLVGDAGARAASIGIAIVLVSSTSAMLLAGPRVYAEMARDGFLPRPLMGRAAAPPRASVWLQGALAIALLHLHSVGELLINVAGILVLFSGLVAIGLFRVRRHRPDLSAPRPWALAAAGLYAVSSIWMLYQAFATRTGLLPWLAAAAGAALAAYAVTRRRVS